MSACCLGRPGGRREMLGRTSARTSRQGRAAGTVPLRRPQPLAGGGRGAPLLEPLPSFLSYMGLKEKAYISFKPIWQIQNIYVQKTRTLPNPQAQTRSEDEEGTEGSASWHWSGDTAQSLSAGTSSPPGPPRRTRPRSGAQRGGHSPYQGGIALLHDPRESLLPWECLPLWRVGPFPVVGHRVAVRGQGCSGCTASATGLGKQQTPPLCGP